MAQVFGIETHLERLDQIAPNGFFFGLHIRHTLPLFTHQTYPSLWVNHYIREAYALRDPIIAWGLDRVGTCRWSEIDIPDPFNILGQAQEFGMNFGIAVSFGSLNSRTIATASRPDREFTDTEIASFADVIDALHTIYQPPESLTDAQTEALRRIAEGDRYAAAAAKLGISQSAFKARLTAARSSLQARTTVEAIQKARDYRLL
ncbi:autoinducer binding domain-containing protein [Marivivens donghaensis]|uniref:autoinducer binding domain-containing protein n=1 Tax=Marivivens donghaensis TaxID=1699413 RepID=UPI00201F3CE5|nr:autoinducer binding domain-containing protein [Marivivens donghaensis]MCL7408598.1 autoinducer binding domain-containing protein [Marivivens donghaensis]MDN3704631.1 autoinducer binding domain-containing protein [Marivivens donghaensis]